MKRGETPGVYRSTLALLLVLLLMTIIHSSVQADIITLKNGGKLEGKVVKDTGEEVTIDVGGAGTVTVRRSEIDSIEIVPESKKPETENNGAEPEESLEEKEKQEAQSNNFIESLPEGHPLRQWIEFLREVALVVVLVIGAIVIVIAAFFMWLSIKIVDSRNIRNSFLVSLGWNALITAAGLIHPFGALVDLVILLVILILYYKLGFLKTIAVFFLMIVMAIGLAISIVVIIGMPGLNG